MVTIIKGNGINKKQLISILIFKSPFPNRASLIRQNLSRVDSLLLSSWILKRKFFMCLVLILLFEQTLLFFHFTSSKTVLRFFHWPWQRGIWNQFEHLWSSFFVEKDDGWKLLAISKKISIIDAQLGSNTCLLDTFYYIFVYIF